MTTFAPLRRVSSAVQGVWQLVEQTIRRGISGVRKRFKKNPFIPVQYIPLKELKVDSRYQRLINTNLIKQAEVFRPELVKPLSVFKRPNGDLMVVDGQHTCVLAGIYVEDAPEFELPVQIQPHPSNFTVEECEIAEAKYFKDFNTSRTNVSSVAKLRADLAQGAEYARTIEDNFKKLGIHVELIGADDDGKNGIHGFKQVKETISKYKLTYTTQAIDLYKQLNDTKTFKGWNALKGDMICGLTATFHFIDTYVGDGRKKDNILEYLEIHLGKESVAELTKKSQGPLQDEIIVERILEKYNTVAKVLDYVTIGTDKGGTFSQWKDDANRTKNLVRQEEED